MNKKKMLIAFVICAMLGGCSYEDTTDGDDGSAAQTSYQSSSQNSSQQTLENANMASDSAAFSGECRVTLGESVEIDGDGVWYQDGVLTVSKGGIYYLSGKISDGCIYIETDENVKLVLEGISVSNSNGAALYCRSAKNLYVELADGTENYFSDGESYGFTGENESSEDDEPNACVYSKSDLIICGEGSLTVTGNYKNGIRCNDDLTVESGNITVTAVNNGIRGSDSVSVEGGKISVDAGKDGIKSTNDTDSGRGYILISGGEIGVTAVEDGLQAEQDLEISGGTLDITTTGEVASGGNDMGFDGMGHGWGGNTDTSSSSDDEATAKGIKCGADMTISGGEITVNSTDHCVHSAGEFTCCGGTLTLSSSMGKGISSHGDLVIDNGTIDVLNSTEGIESKAIFTLNGGEISIIASDDGLNSGGGSDSFGFSFGGSNTGEHDMYINGGSVYIEAQGDGIDSNGNITVNGGTVLVNGPTSGADGALDCGDAGNEITVNGGTLIAVGSSGMAENPSASSQQISLCGNVNISAGENLALTDENGGVIFAFTVKKQAQHVVISSPKIESGKTYSIYTGSSVTVSGESSEGFYESASVSGEAAYTVTPSSTVTTIGSSAGGAGGFGGFGGGMGGHMGGGRNGDESAGSPNDFSGDMPDDMPGGMGEAPSGNGNPPETLSPDDAV